MVHKAHKGNTIAEYIMAAGFVALVAVGGLILIGDSFNQAMAALRTDLLGSSAGVFGSGNGGTGGTGGSKSGSGSTMTVTLSDGSTIQVPVSPSFKAYVETTGVNGTGLMLAVLIELMNDYEKQNKITQEQADMLLMMANQGHSIAEIQKMMEQNSKDKNKTDYFNSYVMFNGQYYQMDDLANQLDRSGNKDGILSAFENLSQQINQQISDRPMQPLINDLSKQILLSADTYTILNYQVETGEVPPAAIGNSGASSTTHEIAKAICKAGGEGNGDTGEFCFEI